MMDEGSLSDEDNDVDEFEDDEEIGEDEDFEDYAIGKLNNTEKRMLGIRSKKRKKKTDPILAENHLMRWI